MLENVRNIHIVGIAGAGLNGIAHLLLDQGFRVTGADRVRNTATKLLEERGVLIVFDSDISLLSQAQALLISSAVKPDHIQVQEAKRLEIPIYTRHDLWEEWSKRRPIIAICGSHGKTTTSGFLANIFKKSGHNFGYQFGSIINGLGSANWGDGGPLIVEADEYARTFLSLKPAVTVMTSIDPDHVDIYPDRQSYETAFRTFAEQTISGNGTVIACGDDEGVKRTLSGLGVITYGLNSNNQWEANNLEIDGNGYAFDVLNGGTKLARVNLQIPGKHIVLNCLAAIAAASQFGIEPTLAREGASELTGIVRRLENKGIVNGIRVFDDYAHMPKEIEATLNALKKQFKDSRIVGYFQPHTFSRLNAFLNDFATALSLADVVCLGDVYGARETSGPVNSAHLLELITVPKKMLVGDILHASDIISEILKPNDVLVVMSAGDGTKVSDAILTKLSNK